MDRSTERALEKVIECGAVIAEVRSSIWKPKTGRALTNFSQTTSQKLSLAWLKSRSGFVLAVGVSELGVTFDLSAFEGTKQIRSNSIGSF